MGIGPGIGWGRVLGGDGVGFEEEDFRDINYKHCGAAFAILNIL